MTLTGQRWQFCQPGVESGGPTLPPGQLLPTLVGDSPPSNGASHILGSNVVQVARRSRYRAMTELLAYCTDILALAPELGGVGVAQPVSVDPLGKACLAAKARKELAHVGCRHHVAVEGAEQGSYGLEAQTAARLDPPVDVLQCVVVDIRSPRFVALAVEHTQGVDLFSRFQVGLTQRQRLGNSQTGAPKNYDQSSISEPGRGSGRTGPNKQKHLVTRQWFGWPFPLWFRAFRCLLFHFVSFITIRFGNHIATFADIKTLNVTHYAYIFQDISLHETVGT